MNLFEEDPAPIHLPEAVAGHEAGHAVLAYYHREQIGPTHFDWYGKELGGRHLHGPPPGITDERSHVDAAVERLVAGDLGGRIVAGLPLNRVSIPVARAFLIGPWTSVTALAQRIHDARNGEGRHDVVKVMAAIASYKDHKVLWKRRWWRWFWERVRRSRAVLTSEDGTRAHRLLSAMFHRAIGPSGGVVPGEITVELLRQARAPRGP
ncbi:MAG TPA: hypothetical protein VF516_43050 [Kofleriaceae bacterium]